MGYGHDEIASYALCFDLQESGKFQGTKHCDTKMPMVCIYVYTRVRVPLYICTAWASVLLFFPKGNTRASVSGTARLQSRFRFYMGFVWRNFNRGSSAFSYVKRSLTYWITVKKSKVERKKTKDLRISKKTVNLQRKIK